MSFDTPILLLVFNRPETTQKVFERIKEIRPSKLFVGADGPRFDKKGEREKCEEVRNIVRNGVDWPCELYILFREENLGSGRAVSGAINWFFDSVEFGIIIEDDILCNHDFFIFCESLLEYYKNDEEIMHISGANCTYPFYKSKGDYYFSKVMHGWGWASWRRAWERFKYTLSDIPRDEMEKKLCVYFNDDKVVAGLMKMFDHVKDGPSDIWDFQWLFRIIYSDGICITPSKNIAINIGFANDATHTIETPHWYKHVKLRSLKSPQFLKSKDCYQSADLFFVKQFMGYPQSIFSKVKKYLKENFQNK